MSDPVAVEPIVERRREQRHQVEPNRTGIGSGNHETIVRRLGRVRSFQFQFIFFPFVRNFRHGRGGGDRGAVVAFDTDRERSFKIVAAFGVERRAIGRVGPDGNAPVAFIGHADAAAIANFADVQSQTRSQRFRVYRILMIQIDRAYGSVAGHELPSDRLGRAVFENAVTNQFGIESAVVAEVDLLGHQAVQDWADLDAGLIDLHGQLTGLSKCNAGVTQYDARYGDQ